MQDDVTLEKIFERVVVLHGPSGGGKSEVMGALRQIASERGIDEVVYISTGDYFRRLAKDNPDIAKEMREGRFIATLYDILGYIKDDLREAFKKDPEQFLIVFDGAFRLGKYQEGEKTIPSQFDQVGQAFAEVLSETGRAIDSETCAQYLRETATHLLVNVNSIDSEILMRLRYAKEVEKMVKSLPDNQYIVKTILGTIIHAMRGQLEIVHGKHLMIDLHSDYSLKMIPPDRLEATELMLDTAHGLLKEHFGGKSLTDTIKSVAMSFGLETSIRADDESHKSRDARVNAFDQTISEILLSELGYHRNIEGIVPDVNKPNQLMIINGPTVGVTYEDLVFLSSQCAETVLTRPLNRELQIFGEISAKRLVGEVIFFPLRLSTEIVR